MIDVPADVNYGYHACKHILVQWGLIQHSLSIGDLQKMILYYALANEKNMVGLEEMGEDSSFKHLDGGIAFSGGQRKNHNPLHVRKKITPTLYCLEYSQI